MTFEAENFPQAIEALKQEFGLGSSYDIKKDPYNIIAFYQAISTRKIELTLQNLVGEIQTLNSKLDDIKSQMGTNASTIADAITGLPYRP